MNELMPKNSFERKKSSKYLPTHLFCQSDIKESITKDVSVSCYDLSMTKWRKLLLKVIIKIKNCIVYQLKKSRTLQPQLKNPGSISTQNRQRRCKI